MDRQQDEKQPLRSQPEGSGAQVGGNVDTGGGNFIGRDMNVAGDFNQTIIVQPGVPAAEDLKQAQETFKNDPLLQTIYEEEECAQNSQVSLHHLVDCTGENEMVLKAKLARLIKAGLVKPVFRQEGSRVYEYYSITEDGKNLVLLYKAS